MNWVRAGEPALVLAPMDGVTDATMRALQGEVGAFSYAVTEFLRVSVSPLPVKVFRRDVPELLNGGRTPSGLPVQIQLLGGDPDRMAISAIHAVRAGATAIDINFGCPAPIVNRHDGGASLLREPCRLRSVVEAVRAAVPSPIPVSAKLRLGWDSIDAIHTTAEMAVQGGAAWLTIHARTKSQGYAPPVYWPKIDEVRRAVGVPVVANGDIWSREDFLRCQEETGCVHFMIGRGALATPGLSHEIAHELGLIQRVPNPPRWSELFRRLVELTGPPEPGKPEVALLQIKQWMKLGHRFGEFPYFDALKTAPTLAEFFCELDRLESVPVAV